ncbi:hypothetical protein [Acetobacter vaccinii]|nr:hypothetical protein [Acetobacter vaccinii]
MIQKIKNYVFLNVISGGRSDVRDIACNAGVSMLIGVGTCESMQQEPLP